MIKQLNGNTKDLYQSMETIITVNNETKQVRIELRYLPKTEKWYLSMFDSQSGESYFRYVPVVSCKKDKNNLIAPFYYKNVGSVVCVPMYDETSSVNPVEKNLGEFMIAWGDAIV